MAHNVVLIPGDGTGPELTEATRRVLEATGVEFEWDIREAGADVMDKHGGNPLPEDVLDAIRETGVALKGPITTPVGGGFRSVNVALRKELDMYAQVRPCKSYPGVRSRFDDVDLIQAISSSASGVPCSYSMPAYRSSVFSRTMIRSTSWKRERTPG